MVALAMVLVGEPRALLLDEPTLGLAAGESTRALRDLANLRDSLGVAIVIVEQRVRDTLPFLDRAVVLKGGTVVFEGSAERLEEQMRVSGFPG